MKRETPTDEPGGSGGRAHDDPGHSPDDDAPLDDAVIGTAFRRSLVVLALLGLAIAGYVLVARRQQAEPPVLSKDVRPVADLDQRSASMPAVRFKDVTRESGVSFVHENGAVGEKLLPETMGSGVIVLDHDGDGDQDLFFANAVPWKAAAGPRPMPALYRNDGAGRFEDVSAGAGITFGMYGTGGAAADYDGDGDPDLYLTALGRNRLLRNDDGAFTDVTDAAGVAGEADAWSTSAGFFDHDNDGDLDLFVCNYVRWTRAIDIELNFTLNGRDRAYGPPTNYEGAHPYLFRNEGGTFTDVSEAAGVRVISPLNGRPVAKALGVTFIDVDRDGWLDVFVANDTTQNFLFHNKRDGTFEEIGAVAGVGFDGAGNATGAMGVDVAHYRNDAQVGIAVGNFANEMTSLYVAQGADLLFTDEAAGEGIGAPSRLYLKFGLFFFDYDLDGRLDLLQANGHLEDAIQQVQASQTYRQPSQLFWNRGAESSSCFAEVPGASAGDLSQPIVGRGAAYADLDADGDLDVVLTQVAGLPLVLRNDQALGHHWLRVRLEGAGANRDAIGAWLEFESPAGTQRRQLMPTRSYLSQVELPVTFGLGEHAGGGTLRVRWPDGAESTHTVEAVDAVMTVRHPGGGAE